MPKNILQDIVPPEKRSIRNIPVPPRKRAETMKAPSIDAIRPVEREVPHFENPVDREEPVAQPEVPKIYPYGSIQSSHSRFGSKKILWGSVGLAAIIVALAFSSLFSGATITITPAEATSAITPSVEFLAKKGIQNDGLGFEVVTLSKNASTEVSATGEERVERKASGTVVIYNDYDANEQRLIKNTRFQTPEGLIYRINESVVVPGRKTQGGSTVPGQIEVTVYADDTGESYNIGKKDFTIPGFKGDPRFEKIYARSKTDMTGGFEGIEKRVSEADRTSARKKLQEELVQTTKNEIMSQIPDTFVMFDDAYTISFKELPQTNTGEKTVTVNEQATITGVIFDKAKLSQIVAKELELPIATAEPRVQNYADLTFAFTDKSAFSEQATEVAFSLDGLLRFVSHIDAEAVSEKLAGGPKADVKTMLSDSGAVKSVDVSIRPFWKRTFPENPEEITVKINESSE